MKHENHKKIKDELKKLIELFNIKDFKDSKLELLIKDITFLNQKEDVFLIVNSCINFIEELGVQKTEFFSDLDKIRKEIKVNMDLKEIKNYGQSLNKIGLNILEEKQENYDILNILFKTYEKKGSIKWLCDLKEIDIRNLHELVDDSDYIFVNQNDIQNIQKCFSFIHNLSQINEKKN